MLGFYSVQCCGYGSRSAWICFKLKGRLRIWIRTNVISWIQIGIRIKVVKNLQMKSQNIWKMSLFEHFFKV
jgi:hypothetical protein